MARATRSLPVPDSPVISTVLGVGAIISISENSSTMTGLRPTMSPKACEVSIARLSRMFSTRSRRDSRCCRTLSRSSSILNGLVK